MTKIAIAFLAWIICSLAQAADLSGVPRVVDGDTLAIGATKVRLEGIDAPETDQICLNANGVRWTCGIDARDQLAAHIGGRAISCSPIGTDAYKRTLALATKAGIAHYGRHVGFVLSRCRLRRDVKSKMF
jgi:endonuclease YncB( thermonuclease family)